jgi:hypothetical protein
MFVGWRAVSAFWLSFLFLPGGAASAAQSDPGLAIDNRVPKFEAFYADATKAAMGADARFALWRKEYGIAAVPPGPDGDRMARGLLDSAWGRYPALLPQLARLESEGEAEAQEAFDRIKILFATGDAPIRARVVLYVGQFDNNAYTVPPMEGRPATVMMPVENEIRKLALAHELTHAVHTQLAGVKNSFGAPVGETVFLEGLAMRTAQRVYPGLPDAAYIEDPGHKGWFAQCEAGRDAVLRGIAADLDKSGREIAMKYTFGKGNTGMQREAYCAAWFVMGDLLESGRTLPELARIPEDRMVATIRAAIAAP